MRGSQFGAWSATIVSNRISSWFGYSVCLGVVFVGEKMSKIERACERKQGIGKCRVCLTNTMEREREYGVVVRGGQVVRLWRSMYRRRYLLLFGGSHPVALLMLIDGCYNPGR